jgi:hypothetical protein
LRWWPNHHDACWCWICRGDKSPHPSDRCHCRRCLSEIKAWGEIAPQIISVKQWDAVVPQIASLVAAGYQVSPVGEIEGDVYIEVEDEAVEMWKELVRS